MPYSVDEKCLSSREQTGRVEKDKVDMHPGNGEKHRQLINESLEWCKKDIQLMELNVPSTYKKAPEASLPSFPPTAIRFFWHFKTDSVSHQWKPNKILHVGRSLKILVIVWFTNKSQLQEFCDQCHFRITVAGQYVTNRNLVAFMPNKFGCDDQRRSICLSPSEHFHLIMWHTSWLWTRLAHHTNWMSFPPTAQWINLRTTPSKAMHLLSSIASCFDVLNSKFVWLLLLLG